MSFFTDPTVTDLIEANIERVTQMTKTQQKKLIKSFRIVRRELMDRLLTIPEGTFTEQQLSVTLVQVTTAIEAMKRDLKSGMTDSAEILGMRGVLDLIKEINRFEQKFAGSVQPLNLNAIALAASSQTFLINKYEASLDAYGEDLRASLVSGITQSMISRDTTQRTVSRLVADIGRFFVGEEWKLNRIVRTELSNVYNFSKLKGMEQTKTILPDLKKSLMHPMDERTGKDSKKLARENPVVDIDEPFRFKFKGEERIFMFPPDRPNDRSILVPFREEWNKRASAFSPRKSAEAS